MKSTLDLRPVYHRLEDRIRAHVILCWLALLLIRLAENATGDTWRNLRHELDRLHAGEFSGNIGRILQRHDLTANQQAILAALTVRDPLPASSTSPPPDRLSRRHYTPNSPCPHFRRSTSLFMPTRDTQLRKPGQGSTLCQDSCAMRGCSDTVSDQPATGDSHNPRL
ncbi:hypothetical protein BH23ACT8_BH23ACT8_14780 [soil metagenome]